MFITIGDDRTFSARCSVVDRGPGVFIYGHLSYTVKGEEIGNPKRMIILGDIATSLTYILGDKNNRRSEVLYAAAARDVMLSLDSELYSVDQRNDFTPVPLPEQPARFDLGLTVETFDEWRLYMVDGPKCSRLIYHSPKWKKPKEAMVPLGVIDEVLAELSFIVQAIEARNEEGST